MKIDPDHCYRSYSQFIKRHKKYMLRLAYKTTPNTKDTYKILGIYPHVMDDEWDINEVVIVAENTRSKQIFLFGEYGIKKI